MRIEPVIYIIDLYSVLCSHNCDSRLPSWSVIRSFVGRKRRMQLVKNRSAMLSLCPTLLSTCSYALHLTRT